MKNSLVITNEKALELNGRLDTLSEDEKALLYVWHFFKKPPTAIEIIVDSDYQYAFTCYGDRIGIVDYHNCPYEDHLYFEGDNNISYIAERIEGSNLRFSARVMDHSIKRLDQASSS